MQMKDSQRIPAPKDKVWAALNDPEVLKKCIPGCQSLEMSSPTEMTATVVFRVGPVKATFGGKVTLSDLDPPNSYRISGEGSGGVAGVAKGGGHDPALRGRRPDRRQAGAARPALDRFDRQKTRRRVLCIVRRGGRRDRGRRSATSGRRAKGWLGRLTGAN